MTRPAPTAGRPGFPASYGIRTDADGLLPWELASEKLASARNYWICTTRPDGKPHVTPVWGLWLEETLYFSTSPRSRKARNLARDPSVVVHLESADDVVILEGAVVQEAADERLADAYETKYNFRPSVDPTDTWFALRPRAAYAWLESDFSGTATRYEWD